eukprot:TRINITY_DN59277_c0_g1_i1.p2 TRINITY_DN59277_c0_g1~~TRINITY_DN59277_c0_g1_i1.p2  ORF type:complete len:288 (+),score=35.99 TRINITY_DN59277_c0_g1_i1:104-865(+)
MRARLRPKDRVQSTQVRAAEARNQGLQKPLDAGNKGFKMLQKMGYVSGQGLGKDNQGETTNIPLSMKRNREGLGKGAPVQPGATQQLSATTCAEVRSTWEKHATVPTTIGATPVTRTAHKPLKKKKKKNPKSQQPVVNIDSTAEKQDLPTGVVVNGVPKLSETGNKKMYDKNTWCKAGKTPWQMLNEWAQKHCLQQKVTHAFHTKDIKFRCIATLFPKRGGEICSIGPWCDSKEEAKHNTAALVLIDSDLVKF